MSRARQPPTMQYLKASLRPFRAGGWVFRYGVQLKPPDIKLWEQRGRYWRVVTCLETIEGVEIAVRHGRVRLIVPETIERDVP